MPALIVRCRAAIGELVEPSNASRSEYISLVETYLAAIEAELVTPREAPQVATQKS
jgi:hypothetical protein